MRWYRLLLVLYCTLWLLFFMLCARATASPRSLSLPRIVISTTTSHYSHITSQPHYITATLPACVTPRAFTVRHASAALQSLNNVDMGKQLVVLQLATPNPGAQRESWAAAALAHASESVGTMPRTVSDQALTDLGGMMQPMMAPNMLMQHPGVCCGVCVVCSVCSGYCCLGQSFGACPPTLSPPLSQQFAPTAITQALLQCWHRRQLQT